MARITAEQWQAIRTSWEYDPDEPGFDVSGQRAGAKLGFKAPNRSSIKRRMDDDGKKGNAWERRGTMQGINAAAHRKADGMVDATGEQRECNTVAAKKYQAAREESEDLRAEVIARHRQEWRVVAALRNEALAIRNTDAALAFEKAKLAKITSEMTKIQQDGERKAWGLDIAVDPSVLRDMTDEQLEALAKGRAT